MSGLLESKTAVVTGGSRGIGRAIAIEFAKQGANVVINYLNSSSSAQDVARIIYEFGRRAMVLQADVRDRTAVEAMFDTVVAEFGAVDIAVNNAGVTADALLPRMSDRQWRAWLIP